MWGRHHAAVPLGVVDVGSNTVRLLVESHGKPTLSLRESTGLGADIERDGVIPAGKLAETAAHVRSFVDAARAAGAEEVEVLITSPGRQAANGAELRDAIVAATTAPVRILSAQEEGRLAFTGALGSVHIPSRRRVAVVDVGGGSSQIVIGSGREGILWTGTIDLGSRRLTNRLLSRNPPTGNDLDAARAEVDRLLAALEPPTVGAALVVGGSARALRAIVGSKLGPDELHEAAGILARTPAAEIASLYDVHLERVRTLAAGAVILEAIQARLRVPLRIVRGAGVREGAAIELASELAAA
jgi:exopolyphosphatase / guanosine-5'-triphosphate,3'-diphosphate pyrophosphatase